MLLGLSFGKLAMVLGGTGQGVYSDASYATVYVRPGPWGSLNADLPAIPSQVFEAALILAAVVLILVVPFLLRLRFPDWWYIVRPALAPRHNWWFLTGSRRFLTALGLWAIARFVAAFTWRDPHVLDQLSAEQLILIGVMVLAFIGPIVLASLRWIGRRLPVWRAARRERRAWAAESKAVMAAEAAELARLAAEAKAAEDAKLAERLKAAEEARFAAEAKAAEAKAAEEAREAEEARLAAEAKAAEEARPVENAGVAVDDPAADQEQAAEEARLVAEAEEAEKLLQSKRDLPAVATTPNESAEA
jgi:hypothetical protein